MTASRADDRAGGGLLAREEFRDRYEALLARHLPAGFSGFGPFFCNMQRLRTLAGLLSRHLGDGDGPVLDLGSGPFAVEIFVAPLHDRRICAVDYEGAFAPFYSIFRQEGVLPRTMFVRADVQTVAFAPGRFDLIIVHDLLYEAGLDLDRLLARHAEALAPGGLIAIDYMTTQTRRLWRLLGREAGYHRYRDDVVAPTLARHGFEVIEVVPSIGSRNAVVRLVQGAAWRLFRISNAKALVARRTCRTGPRS